MAFVNWSINPANNSLVDGITWSNGMLPSQVDDSARQMMSDLAVWRDAPAFNNSFRVGTDSGEGYITLSPGTTTSSGSVFFNETTGAIRASISRPQSGANAGRLVLGNSSEGFYFDGGGPLLLSANVSISIIDGKLTITAGTGGVFYDPVTTKWIFTVNGAAIMSVDGIGTVRAAGSFIPNTVP